MSLNPHYNNGALLLKDVNSNYWYYVTVNLNGGLTPFVEVDQTPVSPVDSTYYAESICILTDNGLYYNLFVYSETGIIYTGQEALITPLPTNRVFLKDENGVYYEAVFTLNSGDGLIYLTLVALGTSVAIVNLPWCPIVPNEFLTQTTVYTPNAAIVT